MRAGVTMCTSRCCVSKLMGGSRAARHLCLRGDLLCSASIAFQSETPHVVFMLVTTRIHSALSQGRRQLRRASDRAVVGYAAHFLRSTSASGFSPESASPPPLPFPSARFRARGGCGDDGLARDHRAQKCLPFPSAPGEVELLVDAAAMPPIVRRYSNVQVAVLVRAPQSQRLAAARPLPPPSCLRLISPLLQVVLLVGG